MDMENERFRRGLEIRKEVLGEAHVDSLVDLDDPFTGDFQRLVTEYCWNGVWGREGLSRKQRSLNMLCLLAALNRPNELKFHVRGALRNGCTPEEIREIFLQVACYCGIPTAHAAFKVGREVLVEAGLARPKG